MINLKLDPEQFLALYNSLNYHLDNTDNTTPGWSDVEIIKDKMKTTLIESLRKSDTSQNQTLFNTWVENEKKKIEDLENNLNMIKSNLIEEHDDGLFMRPENQNPSSRKKVASR